MTDQEIEAARIEQGVPEGSMWMGDGWCLPDTLDRLTAQVANIEAKMALQAENDDPAICHCYGVTLSSASDDKELLYWMFDGSEEHKMFEVWHNPATGHCEPRRKLDHQ